MPFADYEKLTLLYMPFSMSTDINPAVKDRSKLMSLTNLKIHCQHHHNRHRHNQSREKI